MFFLAVIKHEFMSVSGVLEQILALNGLLHTHTHTLEQSVGLNHPVLTV